jgi:pSer/pThr/pTyr-binding forkhead associated (FHA) protein
LGPAPGSARIWLLWNERAIVLSEGDNLVGRDPGCSVWIDASGVSRRHARVEVTREGGVLLEDLGSKNGTLVDGSPITGPVAVSDGTAIQLGSVELKLRIWARGKAPETERIRR